MTATHDQYHNKEDGEDDHDSSLSEWKSTRCNLSSP